MEISREQLASPYGSSSGDHDHESRMRRYGPGEPLVFNHIPKTAGTALIAALAEAMAPTSFVEGLDGALRTPELLAGKDTWYATALFDSPESLPAGADLIAGHISPATTRAAFPDADHMTVLRNPQVRILSHWLEMRSIPAVALRHWGGEADAIRLAWSSLRTFLSHPINATVTDNTITRFLAWPHPGLSNSEFIDPAYDEELVQHAVACLAQFDFSDVIENRDFLDRLSTWLEHPVRVSAVRVRESLPRRRRPDLDAELDDATRELLDLRSRLDVQVWKALAAQRLPDQDPDVVLAESLDTALQRYADLAAAPDNRPLVRRVVEDGYELVTRRRKPGHGTA